MKTSPRSLPDQSLQFQRKEYMIEFCWLHSTALGEFIYVTRAMSVQEFQYRSFGSAEPVDLRFHLRFRTLFFTRFGQQLLQDVGPELVEYVLRA